MKAFAMSAVLLLTFCGFILESAQESPTPVKEIGSVKDLGMALREFAAAHDVRMKEVAKLIVSLRLRHEKPEYLDYLYDPGILTLDSHSICGRCDGWGLQNRDRKDAVLLCDPCDGTGVSVRVPDRKSLVAASRMRGVSRSAER